MSESKLSSVVLCLDHLPEVIRESVQCHWDQFCHCLSDDQAEQLLNTLDLAAWQEVFRAWALSDFIARQCIGKPDTLLTLFQQGFLQQRNDASAITARLSEKLQSVENEVELMACLRQFRNLEMVRIIWRDMTGRADLDETVEMMTALADACIDQALAWLYRDCCEKWGTPMSKGSPLSESVPQQMVVLGMGKLGAYELNVSSDIDLMFTYPEQGETVGDRRTMENQMFFTRLGQRLIQVLDQHTADGFVFRVDMRLRPYGQSGALALSFAAMEEYYQDQGREWERYAMIKARVVGGDKVKGAELMQALKPFVYRKYIDYSVFESLRDMKQMIMREVKRKGLDHNIKLGAGGIREVEFIVQAFQLIRGGRDVRLQVPTLLRVMPVLVELALLPDEVAGALVEAYRYLRDLEHAIQGISDSQTQLLPEDPIARARIAMAMGVDSWDQVVSQLNRYRELVSAHFDAVIAIEDSADSESIESDLADWMPLWRGELDEGSAQALLRSAGFDEPLATFERTAQLRESRQVQMMQTQGRERLDRFMPILFDAVASMSNASETFERVVLLVEAVVRRTAYLVLLWENPGALQQLVWLCSESPWIARQLAETPLLLDELLNAYSLFAPPEKNALRDELRQQLMRIPEDDLEEQMECLRHFKKAHVLRVAASEIRGTLPLMKVSDYLTWIAEAILEQVLEIAWKNMTDKYGFPADEDGPAQEMDFAIIGYGKSGGIELGYTSDLDLVFIHGAKTSGYTNGDRSIDNGVFFTRLGQRIIHILSTQTVSGQIYEVDMRLRPSGNSGLLVSSLKAFSDYQEKDAWTWEHQALVRARGLAGSQKVLREFDGIRQRILAKERDHDKLRQEVSDMREKMRTALGTKVSEGKEPDVFHLKHDRGGIVDIEFLVQYSVLAWSWKYPALHRWSDNIRILETMGECGLITPEEVQNLCDMYKALRTTIHRRALQNLNSRVEPDAFPEERAYIAAMWDKIMIQANSAS